MPTDPPFGKLARSVMTFPWAMSLLGIQLVAKWVPLAGRQSMEETTSALGAITRATHEPPEDWREQAWHVANAVRHALSDLSRMRPM